MVARVMKTASNGTMINTVNSSFITLGIVIGSSLGGLGISRCDTSYFKKVSHPEL